MRRRALEQEVRELRCMLLAHEERRQLAAESERRRRAKLLDALLEIKEWKAKGGTLGSDNMSRLLIALEGWLDA